MRFHGFKSLLIGISFCPDSVVHVRRFEELSKHRCPMTKYGFTLRLIEGLNQVLVPKMKFRMPFRLLSLTVSEAIFAG